MSQQSSLKLVPPPENAAQHVSRIAATFEAEIKRVAAEAGQPIAEIMRGLSGLSGISENHLYNYRNGKTDIPASLIRVFCSMFKSNALADVVRVDEIEFEIEDGLDLAKLCNSHVRSMLEGGQDFIDVFEDGRVTGHEERKLELTVARIQRDSNRLLEFARHSRRRINNPGPVAA